MASALVSVTTLSTLYLPSSTTYVEVVIPYVSSTVNGVATVIGLSPQYWSFDDRTLTALSPLTANAITTPPTTAINIATAGTMFDTSKHSSQSPSKQPTSTSSVREQVSVIPHHVTSRGLGSGAVAGIAIATALIGAVMGAIAFFLFSRRGRRYKAAPDYVDYSDREKETPTAPTSPGITDALQHDHLQFLLDAQSDAVLASELRSLNHLIQQHVEAHYHLNPVQLESSRLRRPLDELGIERGSAPVIARLASLVLEPRTRLNTIRYVIARSVFESTVIGGSACVSMLPPMVSGLGASLLSVEDHVGIHGATEMARTRWRQLTAFLLHPDRSQRTPLVPSEDVSTQQAQELTLALSRFLEPFISNDREERYEQENHLREVITECATFGYVIFSQPAEYRFRFDSNGGLNTIVVCPGLDRLSDEEGRRYQHPVPQIMAPVIESI